MTLPNFSGFSFTAALTLSLLGGSATADIVIINDSFEDGSAANDAGTPLDTAWAADAPSSTLQVIPLGGDQALLFTPITNSTGLSGALPQTISLLAPGDFLELKVTVQYTAAPSDVRNGLRLGFRDLVSAETGASVNPGSLPDESTNLQNDGVVFSSVSANLNGRHGTTPMGLDPHTFTYRLTRLTATTVGFSFASDVLNVAGNTVSATDAITDYGPLTFSSVFLEHAGANNTSAFSIDDVVVTSNVPEPASLMLGLAGFTLLTCRPRRAVNERS